MSTTGEAMPKTEIDVKKSPLPDGGMIDRQLVVLVELKKALEKCGEDLSTDILSDKLLSWLYLLSKGYRKEDDMKAIEQTHPDIGYFAALYGLATNDPKVLRAYWDAKTAEWEYNSQLRWDLEEGLKEGRKEILAEGLEEGRKKGLEEGREEGRKEIVVELVRKGMLERADAAEALGIAIDEIDALLAAPAQPAPAGDAD